ncbi:MAG: rod shape-determining protein MreD [candidate division Zixibacteria bacterium]
MPYFYYFLGWIILIFGQIVIAPRISVTGIYPDMVLATVILIGLKRGSQKGLWFGFIFGISLDLLDPQNLGWLTLLGSISGMVAGMVREKIYVESGLYQSGIIAAITFLYRIAIFIIDSPGYFYNNFADSLITSLFIALYSALFAGIALMILKQRFRLRELL